MVLLNKKTPPVGEAHRDAWGALITTNEAGPVRAS